MSTGGVTQSHTTQSHTLGASRCSRSRFDALKNHPEVLLSAPTMPPSRRSPRRSRDSRTKPSSVGMREVEERLGQRQSKHDEQWNARFKELLRYKSKHGDCNVSTKQGQLGKWVNHQRSSYKDGKLSQDRIDRLSSIGFKWVLVEKVPWEIRFKELVEYKANHGDCNVPQSQGKLGKWVDRQRSNHKDGTLPQDRINRLNGMGFDWSPGRGGSRNRKAPPSTRKQTSRKVRLSSPSTNVNSPSVGDGARCAEPNGFKGEGRGATSVPSLKVPPERSDRNRGTDSDDEIDEIGALIYDQAMRRRQPS